jgi:Kelch motif
MHDTRASLTATLMGTPLAGGINGRVLVAGGFNSSGPLTSAEIYTLSTGSWTPTDSMHFPRSDHTATLLLDQRVLQEKRRTVR